VSKFRLDIGRYLGVGNVCEVLLRNIKDYENRLGYSTDKLRELGRKLGCGGI